MRPASPHAPLGLSRLGWRAALRTGAAACALAACGPPEATPPEATPPEAAPSAEARPADAPSAELRGPGASAAAFRVRTWTTEDGLPAHTVTGLAQSSDGMLWIATTGGLARFDGARFRVHTSRSGAGLPSPRINGLAGGDTLWAVTERGVVVRRAAGRYEAVGTTPTDGPQPVGLDAAGRFHAHAGGRLRDLGGRAAARPVAGPFARDAAGELWVRCDGDRACRVRGGRLEPLGPGGVEAVVPGGERAAALARDGARWQAHDAGGAAAATYPAAGRPLLRDRRGRLWSLDGGALVVAEAGAAAPAARLPIPSGAVSAVLEDREGVVWVATTSAGLVSVRETAFGVLGEADGLPPGPVVTPTRSRLGLAVSATDGRLYRLAGGRMAPAPVPPGRWFGAADGPDGTLWLAGERTLAIRPDGTRHRLDFEAREVVPTAERVWIRGGTETLELAAGADGRPTVRRRIATEPSHALVVGPEGDAWVATDGGLIRIGADGARTIGVEDGLPVSIVRAVHFAGDAVWIGTYGGGLARLRDGRVDVLDAERGLAEDIVSSLFEDASGMLWMGGNTSIHRVARAEAEAVLDGRAERAVGVAYGRDDGLPNPEGSGWPALRASDGRLWFPTFGGVAALDPARALALEAARPIPHVEAVRTAARELPADSARTLGPDERRFEVAFTAASLRVPDRVRFQYRLDGFDPAWVGPTADREATYTNVPPGAYTFRVRARTDDGAWSDEATLALSVAPSLWETAWFRALAALGLLAAIGLAIRARVRRRFRQLRAQARELDATVAARTAELAAEKETVAAQAAELRSLDEARTRLFANVSHEFRTPLTLILGPLADVAAGRHGAVAPEARAQVDLAQRNGRRLLALVEQLLALARHDAGATIAAPVRLDAAAFAARVADAFRPLAERDGVALVTELPACTGAFDPLLVETALANLLANALAFTPRGGTVTLALDPPAAPAAPLAFRVADTGPGLSPEHAARVFDRFYQADDSATRRGSGTGIGLTLVADAARLHGGTARVESEPGHGCTFTLTLPSASGAPAAALPAPHLAPLLAHAAGEQSGDGRGDHGDGHARGDGVLAATPAPPPPPGDAPRVLVVDDNADLRELVARHLDDRYAVEHAADGEAALAAARARVPDAVVSDVMMPRLDGLGLVRALRADPETDFVPVLLLTSRAAVSDTVDGLGAGADDYLAKPFAPPELRARVDALIDGRRRLRERWAGARPEPWAEAPPWPVRDGASAEQRALVARLVAEIDARLDDEALTLDALAATLGMSRATLYRRLRGATDGTPADLLRDVRLDRAAALLRDGAGSVSEVAYAVGFKGVSHFSARFRARYGATPSAYAAAAA